MVSAKPDAALAIAYAALVLPLKGIKCKLRLKIANLSVKRCLPIVIIDLTPIQHDMTDGQVEDVHRLTSQCGPSRLRQVVVPVLINNEMDDGMIHYDFLQIDLPSPSRNNPQAEAQMVGP